MMDRPRHEKLPPETTAIICGSRTCTARGKREVFKILDELRPHFVVQGGTLGIDRAARDWCRERVVPCAQVDAPWKARGPAGGPIRNGWMLWLAPDCVIKFPGGDGTANMVAQAENRGVKVIEAWPL